MLVDKHTSSSIAGRSRKHRVWLNLTSFIIAAILLILAIKGIDWASFFSTIRNGRYGFLLIIGPIASINYFLRAFRWRILLRAQKSIPVISVFWANMVGYMGNAFLPARSGEIMRSVFLGKKSQLGVSYVLATAFVERVIDALALILIGTTSLLWQKSFPSSLINAIQILAGVAIIGFVFVLFVPFQEEKALHLWAKLPVPRNASERIAQQISRFILGMRSLQNPGRIAEFIVLTGLIWFVDGWNTVLSAQIVSQSMNLGQALILLSALGLSSAIPSTPGYIGVYQFVAVTILIPFDFSRSDALSYILIMQVVNYLVVSFWGLIGLWKLNRKQPSMS